MVEDRQPDDEHDERRQIPDNDDTRQPDPQEGQFGEEFGNDYGYGRLGSHIEPDGQEQFEGEEYTRQMDPSEYKDILLDEQQGRLREQTLDKRDDERIYSELAQSLVRRNLLSDNDIILAVDHGIVTLSGTVRRLEAAHEAEQAAREVLGVKRVENHMQVREEPNGSSHG